jgi:hypothetical protein
MIRVEVDDLHEGHAEQQRLHAALPQQQASCNRRGNKVSQDQFEIFVGSEAVLIFSEELLTWPAVHIPRIAPMAKPSLLYNLK